MQLKVLVIGATGGQTVKQLEVLQLKWRQFEPEVILLAVGWYLRFSLSYREVEELLAERGLWVDHVTVWRWVQRYAPNCSGGYAAI
jgi:transposase-like protein